MANELKLSDVLTLEEISSNVNLIGELNGEWIKLTFEALMQQRSHVGQYIFSSTLDTMNKVIEQYGGVLWERVYGRFLFGADDNYHVGDIGGEETHILTLAEMPSHAHALTQSYAYASGGNSATSGFNGSVSYNTANAGGSQAHNNMPPYEVVYIWKRIE